MSNTSDGLATAQYTVALASDEAADIAVAGGKGANLAHLTAAELPVPDGFCVTTAAYREFIDDPEIETAIDALDGLDPSDREAIAETSADLRTTIRERDLPGDVKRAIREALQELDADAYAVRSSATAEDLPTASFAGQHESFLGVKGTEAVLDRVRDCVAGLFTDRAVTYRLENDVPHDDVAMAIVVQAMVDSDVAGVLFTADPLNGNRHVASVDANYGLGDTVVAGEVSPDNARVDKRTGEILDYDVGEKSHALRREDDGGIETVETAAEDRGEPALSDAELRRLVELGEEVESLLDGPQDIEWALVDGELVLMQARPITSLFPLPSPAPEDDDLHVYFSLGHQQAMAEALPPLALEWLREVVSSAVETLRPEDDGQPVVVEAGHRVYVDITPLLGGSLTRRTVQRLLRSMSEPAADALVEFLDRRSGAIPVDGRLARLHSAGGVVRRVLPAVAPALPGLLTRFARPFLLGPVDPEKVRERVEAGGERVANRVAGAPSLAERVRRAFDAVQGETLAAEIGRQSIPQLGAGVVAGALLERLYPDADEELAALGKGFEHEIATRVNQRLGDLADVARCHPKVASALVNGSSLEEVAAVESGETFTAELDAFLEEFGHRASSEMNLSRPRWRNDPSMLLRTVRSTLDGGKANAHREHLDELTAAAADARTTLETRAGEGFLGPLKRPVVRRLIGIYRGGIQLREHHKHGAALAFAAAHDAVREAGEVLAADGRLDDPDDVWYLRRDELVAALDGEGPIEVDVAERRRAHERDAEMTPPPVLTSDGETPTVSTDTDFSDATLVGTPVSAGVGEGPARVVHDPAEESLRRGEILVAPSTDVGWTPLFQNAAGLVMEVGGRMTHGALVAREYGIPAVVSVEEATTIIETGERLRIDGSAGTVELLDRSGESAAGDNSEDGP